jgi:4-hydroxy 2-oxovalerate aldolase
MRIIDCTLRDGGFHTGWHFSPSLVAMYLDALHASGIRNVEIGYRFHRRDEKSSPFAHSTDEFLSSLNIHRDIHVGVMINAGDFMGGGRTEVRAIRRMFLQSGPHPISFVRIAAQIGEVAAANELRSELVGLGYRVHLNLMRMSSLRCKSGWEELDLAAIEAFGDITLADSFGEMLPADVYPIIQRMRLLTDAILGVHMHDNMGLALANTIAAIEAEVDSIDATVAGIGRGAGNVKTEAIAGLLPLISGSGVGGGPDADRLNTLACEFEELQSQHRWGPSDYYFVGALNGIHPTYIQCLCDGDVIGGERILAAVRFLGESGASVFSTDRLHQALDYAVSGDD